MTMSEIDSLFSRMDEDEMEYLQTGCSRPAGLWMTYENPQGERHEFLLRNPKYSKQYRNCIEGDCFSEFQYKKMESRGYEDPDIAVTSHRTFNVSRILKAHVEYE